MFRILSGTTITAAGGYIVDVYENMWSIVNGQVTENGIIDQGTYNVLTMAYVNGLVSFY
jgi:hypothetical protein